MATVLTVDKAGRVVLPKPVRDELQLQAGDSLELESTEEQIILKPVRGNAGLRKKQGVWVFRSEQPVSVETTNRILQDIRREREDHILGRKKKP